MNTNNAPERIEIGGWVFKPVHHTAYDDDLKLVQRTTYEISREGVDGWGELSSECAVILMQQLTSAMQPQVSEGDEFWMARQACREIASNSITAEAEYGARMCSDAIDELIDKRSTHRQSAAVSDDAVALSEIIRHEINKLHGCHVEFDAVAQVVPFIQAYGDACHLDGVRKALSIVVPKAKKLRKLFHDRHVVYVDEIDLADAKDIIDKLRTLSPETVCGGE